MVGQIETLKHLENVEADRRDNDKPLEELKIVGTTVFVNPFEDETKKQQEEEEIARKKVVSCPYTI